MNELEERIRDRDTEDLQHAIRRELLIPEALEIAKRVLTERAATIPEPEIESDTASISPGKHLSPSTIVFWRHLVALFLVLSITPPYVGYRINEFLGSVIAKFAFGVVISGTLMLVALLFFTSSVKEKFWSFFLAGAWGFSGLGVYFWYYGQR